MHRFYDRTQWITLSPGDRGYHRMMAAWLRRRIFLPLGIQLMHRRCRR